MASNLAVKNALTQPASGTAPDHPPRPAPGPAPGATPVPASPGDPTPPLPAAPGPAVPAPTPPFVPAPAPGATAPLSPDAPAPRPTAPTDAPAPLYSDVARGTNKRPNMNDGGSRSVQPRTNGHANPSTRRGPTKNELEEEWRNNPANSVPTAWLSYPGISPAHTSRIRAQILSALRMPSNIPRDSPADPIHCYVFGKQGAVGVVLKKSSHLATLVAKPLTLSGHQVRLSTPDGTLHAFAVIGAPPSRERRHVIGALRQYGRILSAEHLDLDGNRTSDWHGFIALNDGQQLPRSFRFMRQRESTRLVPLAEATPCPFCRQRLAELCPCDAPSCHPMLVESRTAQQVDAARAAMVLPADPAPAPTATEAAVAPCIADPAAIPAAAEMVFPIHPVANKPTADPAFAPSVPQSPATPTTTAPAEPGPATVEHTQSEPDACTIPAAPVAGTENGAQTPLPAPAKQAANTTMHAQALPRAAPTDANTSAETAAPPPIAATTAPTAAATAAPTHPAYYTLPRTPQLDSDAMSTDDSEAQSYETDAMDDLSTKSSESTMSDNESGAVLEPDTEEPSQAPVPLPPLPRMRNGARGTPAPSTAPGELSRRLSKVTKQVARKTDRAELSRIITRSGLPTQPRITTLVSPRPGIPREATLPEDKATDLDAGAPRL